MSMATSLDLQVKRKGPDRCAISFSYDYHAIELLNIMESYEKTIVVFYYILYRNTPSISF
jgi:hypothetical protein